MKTGVQLSHALFDVDFLHKPKMIAYFQRFGHPGITFVFELICQCSRATNAEIDLDAVEGFAGMFKIPEWRAMLDYLSEKGMITLTKSGVTQERVAGDQIKLASRREQDTLRKRLRKDSARIPIGMPTECVEIPDTDTGSEDLDLKNTVEPPEQKTPEPVTTDPEEARRLDAAVDALEVPDSQPWVNSQVFIGTGRRPMRKYPTIFLTPHELAYVFELYETAGIFGQLRKTFKLCESKLSDKKGPGPPVNAYAWLTGFLYREALSAQNEAVKLKANSNRLENGIR